MRLLRTLLTVTLPAALCVAQTQGGPPSPPDPATMIQMRVSHLAVLLSLTDDQKSKATTIYTDAYTAGQTTQSTIRTDRESLEAAVKKNDVAAIDQLSAAIGALSGQLTAINSKADAAFYAILTADQQTKYDSMPHGGPGFGGPGPMGGGGAGPLGRRGSQPR